MNQVIRHIINDFIKTENGCRAVNACPISAIKDTLFVCVCACMRVYVRRTMAAAVNMLAVSTWVRVKGTAPASEATLAMASIVGEAPTM